MASRSRSRLFTSLVLFGGTWLVAHCGASNDVGRTTDPSDGGPTDTSLGDSQIASDSSNMGDGGGGPDYNPLCGVEQCAPDDVEACVADGGAPGTPSGEGGTGGESGAPGTDGPAGGQGGAAEGGAGGEGGAEAQAPSPTGGSGGTGATGSGGTGPIALSCQVSVVNDKPRSACLPAGTSGINGPCFSSEDCQAGLGCVGGGATPICLPFCCAGDSVCSRGSYCAERPLSDGELTELMVPVCVPADDCSLSEPYPCEDGGACSCPEDKACIVVRPDGTTTCATPGQGKAGASCPCAWGYVCSQSSDSCVRLCETARAEDYCGNQQCQASAELPLGWGVCLSPEPDASAAR